MLADLTRRQLYAFAPDATGGLLLVVYSTEKLGLCARSAYSMGNALLREVLGNFSKMRTIRYRVLGKGHAVAASLQTIDWRGRYLGIRVAQLLGAHVTAFGLSLRTVYR
jgi:hypothetical protein